jgi:N,N-dimethylformamidase
MKTLAGYTDRISVAPGERIRFMVSREGGEATYRARMVRLISGEDHPEGPGLIERAVPSPIDGAYPARHQPIHVGSCAVVPPGRDLDRLASFTVQAMVWPTTPGRGRQTILGTWSAATARGFALELDEAGALALRLDGETIDSGVPLLPRAWYLVAASYDGRSGAVRLIQQPVVRHAHVHDDAAIKGRLAKGWAPDKGASFLMAAHGGAGSRPRDGHFNGKIARPRLASRALTEAQIRAASVHRPPATLKSAWVGAWDFALETPTTRVLDVSGRRRHGALINLPTRAMTGPTWHGLHVAHDWPSDPQGHDAIHFHDDDLYDAGWRTDFALTVPKDWASGVYAARIENGHDAEHVVFFVRARKGKTKARAVFVASTATYMAYANFRIMNRSEKYEAFQGSLLVAGPEDVFLNDRPAYGDSTYGLHSDGSGISITSRLRPIVNMRPNTPLWAFAGDMYVLAWADALGYDLDVITDEDLHHEGLKALAPYRVVLTGCHPEYISGAMWDALDAFTHRGGRLMYLGGNGFYWRVAYHQDLPGVMEVRRAEDGTRAWAAEPGEYTMSFTGEYGGMWRRQERAPNRLVGIGFTAQGFDKGSYYVRTAASEDPRAAFIFRGIGRDERIGDFGNAGGGAAGQELDRYEPLLGSPPHALVVATSVDHTDYMLIVNEELIGLHAMIGGTENPNVRADMTFFELPGGGGVFSTGSISWPSSLPTNGFDNNVARITRNVLDRFLDPKPFD